MARMPQITWVGPGAPSFFKLFQRSIALLLGLGMTVQVSAKAPASENDVFQVRSLESGLAPALSSEDLPFDSIEMDLKNLMNPLRPIEVRLWKNNRAYRPRMKFRLLPLDLSDTRIVLRAREKNEEILILVDPLEKKLLRISYRKEESIGETLAQAWSWITKTFGPSDAVATEAGISTAKN